MIHKCVSLRYEPSSEPLHISAKCLFLNGEHRGGQVKDDVLRRGIDTFKTQEMANLVWALSKADHPIGPLLVSVEKDVQTRRMASFQPQELSNLVWAFATQVEALTPTTKTTTLIPYPQPET